MVKIVLSLGVLAVGAAAALAIPAQADYYTDNRTYVADLIDLGVNVTPDNVSQLLQAGAFVCRLLSDPPMGNGLDGLTVFKSLEEAWGRNGASAIVVSAVSVYCPWNDSKVH